MEALSFPWKLASGPDRISPSHPAATGAAALCCWAELASVIRYPLQFDQSHKFPRLGPFACPLAAVPRLYCSKPGRSVGPTLTARARLSRVIEARNVGLLTVDKPTSRFLGEEEPPDAKAMA